MRQLFRWSKRKLIWLYKKIVRENAPPEYIARGWAIGMFYGTLIPFGFQLMLSIPTAFLLRGSKIGSALGTLITNNFTIIFIYPAQCWLGNRLVGGNLTWDNIKKALGSLFKAEDLADKFDALLGLGFDILIAFFVGGAILTAIMTPVTYFAVLKLARKYQKLQEKRKNDREQRIVENNENNGQ